MSGVALGDASAIRTRALAVSGIRGLWGSGSGTTWVNDANPGTDDMTLRNGASYNASGYATFDGSNDYADTAAPASLMTSPSSFAGTTGTSSWNGSGITMAWMLRVQPGDLAGRTLVHWTNNGSGGGTDYCRWMLRFYDNGGAVHLQFWNAYGSDSAPIYLDPVGSGTQLNPQASDRMFTIKAVDLLSLPIGLGSLADGNWHLVVLNRGTTGQYTEKKQLYIDGTLVYYDGTGNGINGFTNFDTALSFGKTETTTLASDGALTWNNFKGDCAMFAVWNRWVLSSDILTMYRAPGGNGIRRAATGRTGRT